MKKFKRVMALALSAAMATSGVQLAGLGDLEAKAATNISRVSVHDPSIFEDNGKFYVFGSHIATASSEDLVNWTQVSTDYQSVDSNTIYGNVKENLKESFKWAGYDDGDCAGGNYAVWAPDVIYNPSYVWEDGTKGAYMLYYSASSTWRRSCIGYMVSKRVDGDYQYGGTVVYSGFTNTGKVNYDGNSKRDTTWTKDYLPFNKLIADGKIDGDASTWKCFNKDGSWNNNYAPNAIDPTLFFDTSGEHLYMVYGSWSGGLFILEIDKETGEAIYPGKDGIEETSGNYVDRYFGVHIAGGNHQSGEGPYIEYDKNTGYYYMYETYGGLTTTGGYNMRLFRSKNVYGPYVDPAGNEAGGSGVDCYKYGAKLIGNYQFYGQPGYRAAGHNSALITEDGKYYNIFHQRFLDPSVGEYHEVRVRQQFLNEDDWLVTAVYENRNEQIQKYSKDDVVGTYEYINHGNSATDGSMLKTENIVLEENGTISGDESGTWTMADAADYTYVTLNIGGAAYKGVFFEQTNDNDAKTMTFTAIGNNNMSVWGSKYEVSDELLVGKVAEQLESLVPSATRESFSLPTSLSGTEISWETDNAGVVTSTGKVFTPGEDTKVTLTATITYGSVTVKKEYTVLVYNGPRIIVGYDFDKVSGSTVSTTSASQISKSAELMGTASVIEDETRGEVLKIENAAGNKQVNYLSLPGDIFKDVDESGYTVSMWVNIGESTWEHSALFEADWVADGATTGTYPMTRIGANLIGRINANNYSDAVPGLNYKSLTGKWQHVTYTVDPNGIKVYLDGNQIVYDKKDISTCFSGRDAAIQNVNHVMVGAGDIWTDEDCRDALFDDIRIYDTALTASEVKSVYDGTFIEKEDDPEEPEPEIEPEPEQKVKPIGEEEPYVEGMTKLYVQLDNAKFYEAANIYATTEDGQEIFGEKPGKEMVHIGNGWYSVNVPEEILNTEENKEEIEAVEAEEKTEVVNTEADVAVDTEDVTEENPAEEAVEAEVTDITDEDVEEKTDESILDTVSDVLETIVDTITDVFAPMEVKAADYKLFADDIKVSINNGADYSIDDARALFTAVRPSAEQLKQGEADEPIPEPEPTDEPKEEPTPAPTPVPTPAVDDKPVIDEPTQKEEPAQESKPQTEKKTNTSQPSSSGSSSSSQQSSQSSQTTQVTQATTADTTAIAETPVPQGTELKTASTTKKSTGTKTKKSTATKSEESEKTEEAEDVIEAETKDLETEKVTTEEPKEEVVEETTPQEDSVEIPDEEVAEAGNQEISNGNGVMIFVIMVAIAAAAAAGVFFVRKRD
ncbi:lipocalin-like domain-containing protein [Pseudobutyrivibrio xylanivorans]|uniref:Beta-xylosidase n=1 Tax=Pseudobutyrivibrio xylanivorans TaxID=185007 RepID=A0A5P6VS17_PSEXY|nr:glycoside hydrolase family 43 C-terminal domain-containing protein [Pseudobutyrivibrio xylanivorans]QFJ54499.1 beta-xylosidase [Pseudobutyrivibrio xylanivorans]